MFSFEKKKKKEMYVSSDEFGQIVGQGSFMNHNIFSAQIH